MKIVRAVFWAILFIILGGVLFALVAPTLFQGRDLKKVGALAFPFIVLICGGAGLALGLTRSKVKSTPG